MKPLGRSTVSIMTSAALIFGMWTLAAWGQAENPPAKTKASGRTSGRGQTAVEQAAKGSSKEATLTGCLSGPTGEGVYKLTSAQHTKGVEVQGESGVDLKPHVGHKVSLTGTWASAAAIGEQHKGEEKGEKHFLATKVEHVAATCAAAGEGKKMPK